MSDSTNARAPLPETSVDEVREHVQRRDGFVLDVRKHTGKAMILGAIRYRPSDLLGAEKLVLPLPKTSGFIALYDEEGDSEHLHAIAEKLLAGGYATTRILRGGYRAWIDAEAPTQEPTLEQPVPLSTEHRLMR